MSSTEQSQSLQTASAGLMAIIIVLVSTNVILRTAAAVLLTLVLPGYSILRAAKIGPARKLPTLALSTGLSMATTVLGGLVLNLVDALSADDWALMLGGVVIFASTVCYFRSMDAKPALISNRSLGLTRLHAAMYIAASALMLISVGFARSGATRQHQYAFTEFWMVPKGAVNSSLITIGITNAEKVSVSYDIALFADDAAISRMPGVKLQPGESWSEDLPLNGVLARAGRVQAWLFKSEAPDDVYRKVWLSRQAPLNPLNAKDPR